MGPASKAEIVDAFIAADSKCLTMIELEQSALFTALSPSVDVCALPSIAHEDCAPYRSRRHVPRTGPRPLKVKRWNRIL